jgi:hypothetical protein
MSIGFAKIFSPTNKEKSPASGRNLPGIIKRMLHFNTYYWLPLVAL